MLSCESYKAFKNTFFPEHIQKTASANLCNTQLI